MSDDLWIMQAPVLSTGHLSKATMEALADKSDAFNLFCIPYDHGVLVFCSDLHDATLQCIVPDDLALCLRWSLRHGYEWTRFDVDGCTVKALPLYAWEGE